MIPLSRIVAVEPRVVTAGSSDLELNGLFFTRNALISADTLVLSLTSAAAVGAYFGEDSDEYEVAQIYFGGYTNKFRTPSAINFALRIDEPIAGWMRSGTLVETLDELKAVTNGGFSIVIDGTADEVEEVDLSTATSLSGVAALIEAKLEGRATVVYSSLKNAFIITSATTGDDSSVSFGVAPTAGTDLSALLALRQQDGALLSGGSAAQSVNAQMSAIRRSTENWVAFTTMWEPDEAEALELATWANANYGWLYIPYTTAATTVSPDTDVDIPSQIMAARLDHVAPIFGTREYAVFLAGTIASIPWNREQGAITTAFKRQAGLSPFVTDETEAATLEAKHCNYYGNWAARNADYAFLYQGQLSFSDYGFIDSYINSIWLNSRLQVAIADGLVAAPRVPYNERGYTTIRAWMTTPIEEAIYNGVIDVGINLNAAQIDLVNNEAGLDISRELYTNGYFLQINDPGASVRAERGTPVISLWYTYGGSVQRIVVASTAIL